MNGFGAVQGRCPVGASGHDEQGSVVQKERLTAFTDGVVAVIITIMVLELKPPHADDVGGLTELIPTFLSYVLSFLYVAIYWNNHHHLFQLVHRVTGSILWANMHLLFWLSLIPFATSWVGDHHASSAPTAVYGGALLLSSIAWQVLQATIIRVQGPQSPLAKAVGRDLKGKTAPLLYVAGILLAFVNTWAADALYAIVAAVWLVPDRRIEDLLQR